jgi:hypothetical protein
MELEKRYNAICFRDREEACDALAGCCGLCSCLRACCGDFAAVAPFLPRCAGSLEEVCAGLGLALRKLLCLPLVLLTRCARGGSHEEDDDDEDEDGGDSLV